MSPTMRARRSVSVLGAISRKRSYESAAFFVSLASGRSLAQVEDVVRLVRIHVDGFAQCGQRERQTVLVKIDHRETGDCERLVLIERERGSELFN